MTECPSGQRLVYFSNTWSGLGDIPEMRASSWCGAVEQGMAWSNVHDPITWRIPYLVEHCTPGVSWSYSHAFPDGSRYYSPSYRGIDLVCQLPLSSP
ncbi:hypothetical protein JRI60_49650 [Archangium violaceum]|uniref:hypothetical protein n=1 Tax=Archangium violaceum TaxID=83451 RepID=UPI00195097E8|nr:hypothetical protein [Archangium violaceum]QRN96949.1 hypothetical protein JRI60_49650 [Archangium violaceum]